VGVKQIPIQNLYYLLCYAWNHLEEGALVDVSRVESTELVDLFATILVKGLDHISRRGLKRGYAPHEDEIRGVRGRIDVLSTERRLLLKHGRVACGFDELTTDILANQIIKTTLKILSTDPRIHPANRLAVLAYSRSLRMVADKAVTSQSFRRIQLDGADRFYRFLLGVCEVVHGSWLPEETKGHSRFRDFLRDEKKMALVFQHFVFNFIRIECPHLKVFRENIIWSAESELDDALSLLPRMQTDISIVVGGRRVIIEAKYYRDTLSEYYGAKSIRSEHLYQLMSYLLNARRRGDDVSGILIYPEVDESLNLSYSILGIPVRIRTLNLAQRWEMIHNELKQLLV
jgi:5-methylcytosine-specific restriction enzyme subunit McrC